jgi:hypothetical protein
MPTWIQITGLERTGGSLIARRLDSDPRETGVFAFPIEFWLCSGASTADVDYNALAPAHYEGQLDKLASKLKHGVTRWTQEEVVSHCRARLGADCPASFGAITDAVMALSWEIGADEDVRARHVVNHWGRSINCNFAGFVGSMPDVKLLLTTRDPADFIGSALRTSPACHSGYQEVLRLSYIVASLMIKLNLQLCTENARLVEYTDAATANDHFRASLEALGLPVDSLDLTPTCFGEPWHGNSSLGGKIDETTTVTHADVDDAGVADLRPFFVEQQELKLLPAAALSTLPLAREVAWLNAHFGRDLLAEADLHRDGLAHAGLNRVLTELHSLHTNRHHLYLNHQHYWRTICRERSLLSLRRYVYRLRQRFLGAR